MSRRHLKLVLVPMALVAALCLTACGTERIGVAKQNNQAAGGDLYHGAILFSERCAGCHTLSYAGTHGSAPNIRVAQGNSGPVFDERCERPIARVLYAIENGGFSGAYMPRTSSSATTPSTSPSSSPSTPVAMRPTPPARRPASRSRSASCPRTRRA